MIANAGAGFTHYHDGYSLAERQSLARAAIGHALGDLTLALAGLSGVHRNGWTGGQDWTGTRWNLGIVGWFLRAAGAANMRR